MSTLNVKRIRNQFPKSGRNCHMICNIVQKEGPATSVSIMHVYYNLRIITIVYYLKLMTPILLLNDTPKRHKKQPGGIKSYILSFSFSFSLSIHIKETQHGSLISQERSENICTYDPKCWKRKNRGTTSIIINEVICKGGIVAFILSGIK
ncbi:hypothetical protein Ahy_B03g061699 isoform A [Arachis hypogaea]|uniref:Uncharacterized protein n=1 Tax=Arachis hypogaea TaxID=3818 RepID=A0A444ZRU2_ARAHY|nr:hypothetical protein Ahy_B03g061699 isoform A [Arachis hypogaea]